MAHAMGEIARIPATDELTRSSSPGHTILSVDDNGINRYLRARTLRAAGFQVIEAENGAGALQKAAERQPSLVLLDVRLPDIDGIEVCSRLKSDPKTAAIPVIHISALGRIEEDMPRALERQSDAYLREPVEPGMLVATIQALIRAHEAEERARKAERRASEILDTIAEPVVAFDKQWRYTYLNRHAAEAFGKSPEEMIGKSIWELFPKDNRKDFEEACGRAWATGKPAACERYSATLGAWVENYIYPFENGASSQWHDITERKRAEAALRESEARLARTQEFSLVMAVHVSLDGKWLKVPPTFVRFLGYDSETELLGRPFKDFTHPEDFRADWSQVLRLKRGEIKSFEMEKRFLRKDGSPTWGYLNCSIVPDENGKPVHLLTYVRDINAQKASEARERARAAELEAIMEAVPIPTLVARDPECRELTANRAGYELLRLPPGSNISRLPREEFRFVRNGVEIQQSELPVQTAARKGRPVQSFEYQLVLPDGAVRDLVGSAVPLFGEDGRPRGAVGAFVDITDRKRNEERLRESQKIESLGLLAGGIAHDFNNLLVGVMGNASLAKGMLPDRHPAMEVLDHIVKSSERAAQLVRQILAYSGKGRFWIEPVNVAQAVSEIGQILRLSVPDRILFDMRLNYELPAVEADRSQIQQIASNLILNASEAIGDMNGTITVETGVRELPAQYIEERLRGSQAAPGTYVFLSVSDDGCGMDESIRSRIFDPFFSTKFTGRGLGLAAVAGILRSHNGAIEVASAPGQGSTFTVWLPAMRQQAGPGRPCSAGTGHDPRR